MRLNIVLLHFLFCFSAYSGACQTRSTARGIHCSFAAFNFLPHDPNEYTCMLEGLNTNWKYLWRSNGFTYASLLPGHFLLKVETANREKVWSAPKLLSIVIIPAFWRQGWFKMLSFLLSFFAVISFCYWFYRNRLKQLNLTNQLQIEKLQRKQVTIEFEKKLAHLTLSALRSQINPHFIFNCLNSIKFYATKNDVDTATGYLTKYSRLIRQVLENAGHQRITLASELEVLQLYIEMEAMRFKNKLRYEILVDKNIDVDFIEIPPLILQPYVENSIWHGLMHKETGGTIEIRVTMKDHLLTMIIQDDGVGREKAAKFKTKSVTQHKSFGMNITAQRLDLISQLYKTGTKVDIEDLFDNQGIAGGTRVTIKIETE